MCMRKRRRHDISVRKTSIALTDADASCEALRGMGYSVQANAYKSGEQFSSLLTTINPDVLLVYGILPGLQEAREAGMHSIQLLPRWQTTGDEVFGCFISASHAAIFFEEIGF